jgi:hypothetical protein
VLIGALPCALDLKKASAYLTDDRLEDRVCVNDFDNICFCLSEGLPNTGEMNIQVLLIPHDRMPIKLILIHCATRQ